MPELHASVIIPVGGSPKVLTLLPQQLDALTRQVDAPTFEVLVVDNGMGPGLQEVTERYENRLNIRIVDATDKQGAAHARNCGATAAHSPRLLFCDADDIVSRDWVREMSGDHLVDSIALHSPVVLFTSGSVSSMDMEQAASWYRDSPDYLYLGPEQRKYFGGNTFALTKADYVALHGMDESFPHGAEDQDFALRLEEAGGRSVMTERCHLFYRLPSSGQEKAKKQFIYAQGEVLLAFRKLQRLGKPAPAEYLWSGTIEDIKLMLSSRSRRQLAERLAKTLGHIQARLAIRVFRQNRQPMLVDFGAQKNEG